MCVGVLLGVTRPGMIELPIVSVFLFAQSR